MKSTLHKQRTLSRAAARRAPAAATVSAPLDSFALRRALADPRQATVGDLLALQRSHGNRAATNLIQTRLMVGSAGDTFEQGADPVAKRVTNAEDGPGPVQRQEDERAIRTRPAIQRASPGAGFEADEALSNRLAALQGGGHPLPPTTQAQMESSLGADLSGVRLHTGSEPVQLNRALQAKAFTHGRDIYFGAEGFAPETSAGKRLIAHELTHVVQQTGGGPEQSNTSFLQRFFTLQPGLAGGQPTFTAAAGAQFPSQDYVEGEARRQTKTVQAGGNLSVQNAAHGALGFQPQGGPAAAAMNTLSLNVSQNGRMAIESTTAQPRAFYADNQTVTNSNQKLRDLASPVRLEAGGSTVQVPQNPDPLNHDATPRTLDMVTPEANIPADHPGEQAGQALLNATTNSECNNVVRMILGAAQSARKAVLGTAAGGDEREVEGREQSEPIYEIANFVSNTNVGSANVGALATATQTRVPANQQLAVEGTYNAAAAPNAALGINAAALPDVGEGYAIRSMAQVTRPAGVTFTNVSGTDADDQYLDAVQRLQAANGLLDTIILNRNTNLARANRVMEIKTFWGEHYAGVVAKDGADTITYENYNRAPQWKWPINEAFQKLYLNMATFRQYVRGLNQALQGRNVARQKQMIDGFANHVATTGVVLPALEQQMVAQAVATARGNIVTASDLAKDMMYFQMYGQGAGQSFHEKFTTSQNPMAATANAMTLRVRTNLNQHRQNRQNYMNPKIAAITAALNANSTNTHLNATLLRLRQTFAIDSVQIMNSVAAATTVREVEEEVVNLKQARDDIWDDLAAEVLLIEPTAVPPANRTQLAAYVQTLVAAYHIGRNPRGRGARKIHKRALQTVRAVAAGLPTTV